MEYISLPPNKLKEPNVAKIPNFSTKPNTLRKKSNRIEKKSLLNAAKLHLRLKLTMIDSE